MTTSLRRRLRTDAGPFPTPLSVTRNVPQPLHQQIYAWYRSAISLGTLAPGQTLPSTRALAEELGVSRAPVLMAFEQLATEGYVEAAIGSGTRVCATIPGIDRAGSNFGDRGGVAGPSGPRLSLRASAQGVSNQPWNAYPGAFRVSMPAIDRFPSATWSRLMARNSRGRSAQLLGYGDPMGHLPLREAIAHYLGASRGVRCTAAQVMVVSGSQQGIHLAARTLLDPGDGILMEEPGYPGAHAAFAAAQLNIVPVPVDAEGMTVDLGVCRAPGARAAYVTPSHQYPMGSAMSAARRLELLAWCRRAGSWIIEDDYDSEYRFGARPLPALQGADRSNCTVYVGTFSKTMFPALRVGYLVVPEDVVPAFKRMREEVDVFPATQSQAALTDFIVEGHFARHLRRMRTLYGQRRNWLVGALSGRLGAQLEVRGIAAGMYVTALLGAGADDVSLSCELAKTGVSAMPLSTCFVGEPSAAGLVLGYGNADELELKRGVAALDRLLL